MSIENYYRQLAKEYLPNNYTLILSEYSPGVIHFSITSDVVISSVNIFYYKELRDSDFIDMLKRQLECVDNLIIDPPIHPRCKVMLGGKEIKGIKSVMYPPAIRISDLESDLKEAVISEDYEKAAQLRDKIEQLKSKGKG